MEQNSLLQKVECFEHSIFFEGKSIQVKNKKCTSKVKEEKNIQVTKEQMFAG